MLFTLGSPLEAQEAQSVAYEGFRLAYEHTSETHQIREFVPLSEDLQNWRSLITHTQTTLPHPLTAQDYAQNLVNMMAQHCSGLRAEGFARNPDISMETEIFIETACPLSPFGAQTPENAFIRVRVRGSVAQTLQIAWRKIKTPEQSNQWLTWIFTHP